jgi:hypothetical protein
LPSFASEGKFCPHLLPTANFLAVGIFNSVISSSKRALIRYILRSTYQVARPQAAASIVSDMSIVAKPVRWGEANQPAQKHEFGTRKSVEDMIKYAEQQIDVDRDDVVMAR